MTTILKEDTESKRTLRISDDGFDVLGWVELAIVDNGEVTATIDLHLNELFPALIGFHAKYTKDDDEQF